MRESAGAARGYGELAAIPPTAHLASVRAELPITSPAVPGKPPAAAGSGAAGGGHDASGLGSELLPDGIHQSCGAVAEGERAIGV